SRSDNGFATEDSGDRTHVASPQLDSEVHAEADAAFAAIGLYVSEDGANAVIAGEELHDAAHGALESPFDESSSPLPDVDANEEKAGVDLDLGLDQVAIKAQQSGSKRRGFAVVSSAPEPTLMPVVHDTGQHDTSAAAVTELTGERDKLKREVEELR